MSLSEIAAETGLNRRTVRKYLCSDGVGAENSVTSCDMQILVHQAAEAVSSYRSNGRAGGRASAACGRVLIE
jgi:hypothetical protein